LKRSRASKNVTADELFELVTALSWAVDRFGDDVERPPPGGASHCRGVHALINVTTLTLID
jgi:hypothetical protein